MIPAAEELWALRARVLAMSAPPRVPELYPLGLGMAALDVAMRNDRLDLVRGWTSEMLQNSGGFESVATRLLAFSRQGRTQDNSAEIESLLDELDALAMQPDLVDESAPALWAIATRLGRARSARTRPMTPEQVMRGWYAQVLQVVLPAPVRGRRTEAVLGRLRGHLPTETTRIDKRLATERRGPGRLLGSRLEDWAVRFDFPWLAEVNPLRGKVQIDSLTGMAVQEGQLNCVMTTIATEMTLASMSMSTTVFGASGVRASRVRVEGLQISNVLNLQVDRLGRSEVWGETDFDSIVEAMGSSRVGSRGVVVVKGEANSHAFNVIFDGVNGGQPRVRFLDGQLGGLPVVPRTVVSWTFLPLTNGIPKPANARKLRRMDEMPDLPVAGGYVALSPMAAALEVPVEDDEADRPVGREESGTVRRAASPRYQADLVAHVNSVLRKMVSGPVPAVPADRVVKLWRALPEQEQRRNILDVAHYIVEARLGRVLAVPGGYNGFEAENHSGYLEVPEGVALDFKTLLVSHPDLDLVVDYANVGPDRVNQPVIEVVSKRIKVLDKEEGRSRSGVLRIFGYVVERLMSVQNSATLGDLFTGLGFSWPNPEMADVVYHRVDDRDRPNLLLHYSVDVPMAGLIGVLRWADKFSVEAEDETSAMNKIRGAHKIAFGFAGWIATKFLTTDDYALDRLRTQQESALPALSDLHLWDEDVAALEGFMALTYIHVASTVLAGKAPLTLPKSFVLAASRASLSEMRQNLSERVQAFLEADKDDIAQRWAETMLATSPTHLLRGVTEAQGLLDLRVSFEGRAEFVVGDYLMNALSASPSTFIRQAQAMDVGTELPMNADSGVATAVLELRYISLVEPSIQDIEDQLEDLEDLAEIEHRGGMLLQELARMQMAPWSSIIQPGEYGLSTDDLEQIDYFAKSVGQIVLRHYKIGIERTDVRLEGNIDSELEQALRLALDQWLDVAALAVPPGAVHLQVLEPRPAVEAAPSTVVLTIDGVADVVDRLAAVRDAEQLDLMLAQLPPEVGSQLVAGLNTAGPHTRIRIGDSPLAGSGVVQTAYARKVYGEGVARLVAARFERAGSTSLGLGAAGRSTVDVPDSARSESAPFSGAAEMDDESSESVDDDVPVGRGDWAVPPVDWQGVNVAADEAEGSSFSQLEAPLTEARQMAVGQGQTDEEQNRGLPPSS